MAPTPYKSTGMVLLSSTQPWPTLLKRPCARCISFATRSSFSHDRFPRQSNRRSIRPLSRPLQRRQYSHIPPPPPGGITVTGVSHEGRIDPSAYMDVDPSKPLPADGKHIAIIGGGLTGLTTAYYMSSVVRPSTKITLYEASPRLGGWVKTDKVKVDVGGKKGTVNFERGPRSLSSLTKNKSRFDDLVLYDLCIKLGLKPQVAPTLPRYIYYPDHLVPVPTSIGDMVSSFLKEELWWKTLPAAALGWLRYKLAGSPPPSKGLTIAEFIQHFAGTSAVVDNIASAMIHGIYGGDVDSLSADEALYPMPQNQRVPEAWKKSTGCTHLTTEADRRILQCFLNDPAVRKMTRDVAQKGGALLHFGSQGLQALPDAIEAALRAQPNVEIKTNSPLRKIEYLKAKKQIQVTEKTGVMKRYDKVYTTIGAHDLRPLVLGKLKTLQEFESVSIMAVNLWFPQPNLKPPGFGYLIPRSVSEERNPHHALGVFFDSDIGNNHPDEPEGTKLFVLMGGHHYEKPGVSVPTPDEAVQQARELLEQHLGIPQSLPCHAEARFSHNCIPQHNVGHMQRVADLLHQLEDEFEGRLVPTGGSFTRIGGMAALGDGFHAGTTGLDPSKPQAVATWEALVGPITGGHMNLSPLWNDALTGVRPALFTPIKGAPIPRVSLSPDGENVLFTYPHETGKYPVGVSGKTNSSQ